MKAKYTANWGVQISGMIFQTLSRYIYPYEASFHKQYTSLFLLYNFPVSSLQDKPQAYKKFPHYALSAYRSILENLHIGTHLPVSHRQNPSYILYEVLRNKEFPLILILFQPSLLHSLKHSFL